MLELLHNPALAARLAETARKKTRARFSLEKYVAELNTIYIESPTKKGII